MQFWSWERFLHRANTDPEFCRKLKATGTGFNELAGTAFLSLSLFRTNNIESRARRESGPRCVHCRDVARISYQRARTPQSIRPVIILSRRGCSICRAHLRRPQPPSLGTAALSRPAHRPSPSTSPCQCPTTPPFSRRRKPFSTGFFSVRARTKPPRCFKRFRPSSSQSTLSFLTRPSHLFPRYNNISKLMHDK